jgi:hypothetical protein
MTRLDWLLVVDPARYGTLPENVRHEVARSIGAVNRALGRLGGTVLALGPGRWGTHMAFARRTGHLFRDQPHRRTVRGRADARRADARHLVGTTSSASWLR